MQNKRSQISVNITVNKARISELSPSQPTLSVKISLSQPICKSQNKVGVHDTAHS